MINIRPTGDVLGATITGIDLSRAMSDVEFSTILQALGEHGVLRFPDQLLEPAALRDFSMRFGSIQASVTGKFQDPHVPEVGILSNIVEDGKPIGIADAGQDWHTDMSYRDTMGFVNVLNAHKVPRRDGKPLGNTLFANTPLISVTARPGGGVEGWPRVGQQHRRREQEGREDRAS